MCKLSQVSRSGYYNWLKSKDYRGIKDEEDRLDFKQILEAYNSGRRKKGIRSIYMWLLHKFDEDSEKYKIMNPKKIRRLMRKFKLYCPIRKANPYRRMAKAMKSDNYVKNIVDREFKKEARCVLLTDITYLKCSFGFVYMSSIKDAFTNEILAYRLSKSLEVDFVLDTFQDLFKHHGETLKTKETLIHSDQGCHYTSMKFIDLMMEHEMVRSMSRRGNCWDNAPQESFHGHMKDEIDLVSCHHYEDVCKEIDDYINYYNNKRYQWGLAKLSPNEFYKYSLSGEYPLKVQKGNSVSIAV